MGKSLAARLATKEKDETNKRILMLCSPLGVGGPVTFIWLDDGLRLMGPSRLLFLKVWRLSTIASNSASAASSASLILSR